MSNSDTLKAAYEAFGRGDVEAAFSQLDEECVFHNGSDKVPAGGDFHGKADIMGRWLPELGANYEGLRLTVEDMIGDGDAIAVNGMTRSKVAGVEIKSPFCHVWRYRDGKVVDARFHTQQVEAYIAVAEQAAIGARHN
jgi:ketosteroid isomerase-like protein